MTYLQNQIENLVRIAQEEKGYEPYYEVLESITFNKTQMFWLPVKPAPDVKIDITFKSDNTSETQCLFGGRINASGSNRKMFAFWECVGGSSSISGYMRADYGNSSTASNDIGLSSTLTDFRNFVKDGADNYIDGVKKTSNTGVLTEDDTNTYIALGCMSNGTESSYSLSNPFSGDVAQLKIWKAGTQIADYVPVLDNKMRPCLYDKISKTFTYAKKISDGTTTYDLGFKRWNKYDVDYISSDGNQYINTGFKFTNTSAFEITCAEVGDFESSTVLCGARNNTDTTSNARIVDYSYSAPSVLRGEYLLLQRGGYDVNENVIYIPYDTEFHTYYQSPTRMSIDDTDRPTVPSLTSPNMDFYIFWQNVGTATAPAKAKIKVKNLKLWDNGTLVRDLKPSVRTYNDGTSVVTKAFMYDEVYNKAYDNAGTGSFKAYIEADREVYNLSMHDTMDINGFYLAEDGTKTVSSDGTSCYTEAIQVKQGDIIEWTVTAEAVTANKRIHGYSTDADITTGQKGSWVEMLAKIVFSTTSETTQTASFVVPSGINYIRLSHANTRETKDSIVRIRTYEVGKAIKFPQNNGFTLDAPNSSNFILDLLTRATTTSSYYILDTRNQTGSNNEEEFGIGGSSTGSTVNWKCESDSNEVSTNGVNWTRTSGGYTYSQMLVGYKEGNTFKRTAVFYDFNNQKTSDITIVTATRDIANNTKPLTVLHTTSSNWLQNGAEVYYFKYLQDDNDVWYDCIPVRNATLTSSILLFDRANNTSLPNTGSGTPTFVALD